MRRLQTFLMVSFGTTALMSAGPVSARRILQAHLRFHGNLLRTLILVVVGTLFFLCLPLAAQAQLYQGVANYDQTGGSAALAFDLNMNPKGGPITGYFGDGQPGTNPPAVTQLRGTKSGNHCTVTVEVGGATFDGICDNRSFSGTFRVGTQTGRFAVYTWSGANCTSPDQALTTPRPPESTQQPTTRPGSQPNPETSQPLEQPVQPEGPVKYCGTFHNETYNSTGPLEIDFTTAGSFNGAVMKVGSARENNLSTFGGGKMKGTFDATSCSGTTEGGIQFQGTCTATKITASYTVAGQKGTFTLTKGCR